MLTFSTDDLPAKDRFDHWVEVRGKQLFGVTIELEKAKRGDFHGRFSAATIGSATLAEMHASTYRVSRTQADIDRLASDSLCISEQVRGPGWMDIGRDRVRAITNSALIVSHSDMPYTGIPTRTDGFHFRMLKIPLKGRDTLAKGARALDHEPLAAGLWLTKLIGAGFAALVEQGSSIADPEAAVTNLGQLALLVRGRAAPGSPESRAAIHFGQYHVARRTMIENLHRADLSPALVAKLLGISVRGLHLLFEPTGQSFSRAVTAARLAEAHRQLLADPARPVVDIAFACGFESMATFYRVFRHTYGFAPSELRNEAVPHRV
ncbi:AraC family transcriptional regulator [Hyphomicrobium sp.]|uniref:helix-turn-helix transcriptional regulator n=1 Tax=Hyphomicrobium sp. TaxID=82 RepID=UPI002E32E22B|nr:AraC family transcriptional regulator [Hyphomicrobium sp.]HEX2841542.1 AraC family transcriptional regulator [Hyphomicrobium sp.]